MGDLTHEQRELIYWIKERNAIRKEKGYGLPKPWTSDPVMQSVYFCNVNREDDRVTRWIRQNWKYTLYAKHYEASMVAARIFNRPETLHVLGQPVNFHHWLEAADVSLKRLRDDGKQIWSGAYLITTCGKKMDKVEYCLGIVREFVNKVGNLNFSTTLAEAHAELMTVNGLGSFLAAQVVADLKNTEGHHLAEAPDWHTFSAPGPGSIRGLSWFWGNKVTYANYHDSIESAYKLIHWELPQPILDVLCMQNLQNCFCEFDKYMRVKNGTGRSKRKYSGGE